MRVTQALKSIFSKRKIKKVGSLNLNDPIACRDCLRHSLKTYHVVKVVLRGSDTADIYTRSRRSRVRRLFL